MEFYRPQQHDTAAAVADGYDNNFQTLDTAKAEAGATAAALAGKVDKVEGHDLMTAEERVKLAGIAEGANAYSLPAASATTLGGVKVGNNLTIRPDGTLDAQAGGSGGGNSILVLPYVAPEKDADGNITNSAAFVAAWGAILSRHIAAPDQSALYMEIDGADGMMLRTPCTLLNMGGDADTVQWLISGFAVVNIPASSDSSAPCKTTVMVAVVCDGAGEMQSVAMYASTGLVGPDGRPNLLGGDNTVVIDFTDVDTSSEAQLKAAVQQVLPQLLSTTGKRCTFLFSGAGFVHATYVIAGSQLLIAATGILDITDVPFTDSVPIAYYLLKANVQGTTVQNASFQIKNANLATNASLDKKADILPQSFDEQLVPGEFWPDMNGNPKQVYIRTFAADTVAGNLAEGIYEARWVRGGYFIESFGSVSFLPPGIFSLDQSLPPTAGWYYFVWGGYLSILTHQEDIDTYRFNATFKYTKA